MLPRAAADLDIVQSTVRTQQVIFCTSADGQTAPPVRPDGQGDPRDMSEHSFVPAADTARDFRDALGCFATGVTVITAQSDQGPLGMTANSFASLSLDPPLVLWAPAKSSRRHASFAKAAHFAIHVMAEDQHDLAHHFAKNGDGFDAFDWSLSALDVPILEGCLARFECHLSAMHDAGDHTILVGHVDRATYRPGKGLIFKRGQYGGFAGLD